MNIQCLVMGHVSTNAYILKKAHQVVLIDPVQDAPRILSYLDETDEVIAILLTHGHFDHIGAVDEVYQRFQCPIYLHTGDHQMAQFPNKNFSFKQNIRIQSPLLSYPDVLDIGLFHFEIYETPGHSEGSVVIKVDQVMFTGDTLFKGDIGRTDLEGSDPRKMRQSLKLFKTFDQDYILYPGHDESSTLFEELKHNPYL
jgi:hydroxyacylglutathione hydrolase